MEKIYDLIVVGGGASGLTAAITAAERGFSVLVLERALRAGRKILASGNGRCNMMNMSAPRYFGDAAFAEGVLSCCGAEEISSFFHRLGLLVRTEAGGLVYPVTFQAASVLQALEYGLQSFGVHCIFGTEVTSIQKKNDGFLVSASGQHYFSERVLVSCGGSAQPKLGGTESGYRLLSSLGHTMIPVFPSLVPVNTDKRSISGLSGLRVRCVLSLFTRHGDLLRREKGEMLFTDYGVSGICVMQCSRQIIPGCYFEADFFAPVFDNPVQASVELSDRFIRFSDQPPLRLLEGILNPRLAFAVLKQAGIPLRGEKVNSLPSDSRDIIISAACHYRIRDLVPRGLDQAQVTAGGISCEEFEPTTMESRLVRGLYASGEVLNIDGDCGGFNLMFAFATGMIAGGFRKKDGGIQ